MKTGKTLVELATEIQNQQTQKQDYILPARAIHAEIESIPVVPQAGVIPTADTIDRVRLNLGDRVTVDPNEVMAGQLSSVTGIPMTYYRRMADEAPALLADNLNTWLARDGKDRLVRTFQNGHNVGRALLSDRYRALDYADLAEAVLPIAQEQSLALVSSDVTERRLYLKFVSPRIEGEVKVGDVVRTGVIVHNSEVGSGTLAAEQFIERLVCTNGMVRSKAGESFRKRHLGARAEGEGFRAILSDEARNADDAAVWLAIRDMVKYLTSQEALDAAVADFRRAAAVKIDGPDVVKVVDATARRIGLTQDEGKSVLRHLIEGGDLSQWGLANAVTRYAEDAPSYDRATEVEALGAKVIDLSPRDWKIVNAA